MVLADVLVDARDELVVGVALYHLAALAVDHPSHRSSFVRGRPIVAHGIWHYLGDTLGCSVQLCGRLVIQDGDERMEDRLPGRQGRRLFAYLALNRHRPTPRAELIEALWPDQPPAAADSALSALLSKLRRGLPVGWLAGRDEPRLALPADTLFDVEAARE